MPVSRTTQYHAQLCEKEVLREIIRRRHMQSARLRRNFPQTAITSPAFYKFSRLDGMTLNVRMAQNPAIMTIFTAPQSTHQFDPGNPVMTIPNPVGKTTQPLGSLH